MADAAFDFYRHLSEGKLFGSIGTTDIAEACTLQGYKVLRSEVRLSAGPLRMVGEHMVTLHLHTDIDQMATFDTDDFWNGDTWKRSVIAGLQPSLFAEWRSWVRARL